MIFRIPHNSYPHFDFDDLEDDECLSEFRFYKNSLPFLAEVLGIPEVVECYQRDICSGSEALCIFLKRQQLRGPPWITVINGFIDGTVRPISKPGQNQHIVYNGHKRVHSVTFQSVKVKVTESYM